MPRRSLPLYAVFTNKVFFFISLDIYNFRKMFLINKFVLKFRMTLEDIYSIYSGRIKLAPTEKPFYNYHLVYFQNFYGRVKTGYVYL
jgi:hypothetical protein